jgi:hypothetical protein
VWPKVSVGESCEGAEAGSSANAFAKPKSSSFTFPSGVIFKLAVSDRDG